MTRFAKMHDAARVNQRAGPAQQSSATVNWKPAASCKDDRCVGQSQRAIGKRKAAASLRLMTSSDQTKGHAKIHPSLLKSEAEQCCKLCCPPQHNPPWYCKCGCLPTSYRKRLPLDHDELQVIRCRNRSISQDCAYQSSQEESTPWKNKPPKASILTSHSSEQKCGALTTSDDVVPDVSRCPHERRHETYAAVTCPGQLDSHLVSIMCW